MAKPFEKLLSTLLRSFDNEKLISLRQICREDAEIVAKVAEILLEFVQTYNLSVRYNCVEVAKDFFKRSHVFRERITDDLQNFLLFTVETDPLHYPIVGSKEEVKRLKNNSLKTVCEWHRVYGKYYTKLNLAMDFLKTCKTIDLDRLEAETVVERRRKNEQIEKENNRRRLITEKIRLELEENENELIICLKELENGFDILLPKVSSSDEGGLLNNNNRNYSTNLSLHGIYSRKQDINIEIKLLDKIKLEKNLDNEDLLKILKDSYKILKEKFSTKLNFWLKNITKNGIADEDLVKKLIDYREKCKVLSDKFQELNIVECKVNNYHRSLSEEEDDFVEVSSENPCCSKTISSLPLKIQTTQQISDCNKVPEYSTTSATVPKLTYGLDFWDNDYISSSITRNDFDCHRFWRPTVDPDESLTKTNTSPFTAKKITFAGKFEPVERECGALLPNGATCKRMDRKKCPFHGLIDEKEVSEPSTSKTVDCQDEKSWKLEAFSDPVLIKEIETATGVKLTETSKAKKLKKVKGQTLVSSRDRLLKKVTNRSSVKRVNSTLNEIDAKKYCDKFSHQWNYSVNT